MKLLGGFLNTDIFCGCKDNFYSLPLLDIDEFYLIVEDEIGSLVTTLDYVLVAQYGNKKIYKFKTGLVPASSNSNVLAWREFISSRCGTVIEDYCGNNIEQFCSGFGSACFRYADCYDSILEWEQKYFWYPLNANYFTFKQRLPIRITKPQPKIEGVKTYQKSNGTVMSTGKIRTYIEYTLETEFMPEVFHRQLIEVLTKAKNMKINGKNIEFAGDYQIDWNNKNDCFARASCKIIEQQGNPINC